MGDYMSITLESIFTGHIVRYLNPGFHEVGCDDFGMKIAATSDPITVRALDKETASHRILEAYRQNEHRWTPERTSARHPDDVVSVSFAPLQESDIPRKIEYD